MSVPDDAKSRARTVRRHLGVCERIEVKSPESGVRRRKSLIPSSLLPSALRNPYSEIDPFTTAQSGNAEPARKLDCGTSAL
jgi:hypothetical protein